MKTVLERIMLLCVYTRTQNKKYLSKYPNKHLHKEKSKREYRVVSSIKDAYICKGMPLGDAWTPLDTLGGGRCGRF